MSKDRNDTGHLDGGSLGLVDYFQHGQGVELGTEKKVHLRIKRGTPFTLRTLST